jgi:hypothetical protein
MVRGRERIAAQRVQRRTTAGPGSLLISWKMAGACLVGDWMDNDHCYCCSCNMESDVERKIDLFDLL